MKKMIIERFIRLLHAAKAAHYGKNKTLAVRRNGQAYVWRPEEDSGWNEYRRARDVLYKHPWIAKTLQKIGYI